MCGIVGYTGPRDAAPVLLAGLRRLEYRGYDSAGLATLDAGSLTLRKTSGRVRVLEDEVGRHPAPGSCGIGHTRWATHGPATDINAHPHLGGDGCVAVVHNGVIDNYAALKRRLQADGLAFLSQTDTEVIAHLIARAMGDGDDLLGSVLRVLPELEGTYGLAAVSPRAPGLVVGARLGSPLVLGIGDGEHLLASDPTALAAHTTRVVYLQDGEVVRLDPAEFAIHHRDRGPITPRVDRLDWKPDAVELGGHSPITCRKRSIEQPDTAPRRLSGPIAPRRGHGAVRRPEPHAPRNCRRVRRVVFAACGTSWHAALVGEYLIERLAHLPVEVEYASEFRYRNRAPGRPHAGVRPQPVGRDGRHPGRPPRGQAPRPPHAGDRATPWAARSPARPTAASTSTPARKWAWPAPRRSRRRSMCPGPASACNWAACGTCSYTDGHGGARRLRGSCPEA